MTTSGSLFAAAGAILAVACASGAGGDITVYDNFGPGHDGFDYNWGLGWSVAGEDVAAQFGIEQAFIFDSTADGVLSNIWVAFWFAPLDGGVDEVIVRLAHNPNGLPPTDEDVMEQWTISEFEDWSQWREPIQLVGAGSAVLEKGQSYWLWASAGTATTWTGWAMNLDPAFTAPHTLRREGEDWLPIGDETASAFRVDVTEAIDGDLDGDGVVGTSDLLVLLGAWGRCDDCDDCPADLDGDCAVGSTDLIILLGNWG